ncbi:septal ring lytic transglycosylase RlpA family protein [Halomonas campisalis]|uniref:Endolytic peptidoglycan transglycosylase RlpA n=1 Tax=Billgrantia campisalis TaxID=74661 RepID=A0ABS9P5L6_9GAMM|nr:septal ring lytic transglycosylase RlpA family protein [Halomonas campisalis]MCG6656385.1 septal ring lytic transglycosylase RlpA family protein [Halomonas campisalis]MDR5861571.1 septal ring lytic transglycosylase RlpA family protein [Halomonas campisalis]
MKGWAPGLMVAALLAGCAGGGSSPTDTRRDTAKAPAAAPSGQRYAMSGDAYPEDPPDVSRVPDAVPRVEALSRGGNRPTYEVWGKTYRVLPDARGYARRGTASWYGEKFHGYATSNGEIYDMYKMTAAHRSLPLPTYARVTSLDNGRSVIVRVNDRGPFHNDREIDLSYAAAARLDILDRGTGRVKVEAIDAERWLAEHGEDGGRRASGARSAETVADAAEASARELAAAPTAGGPSASANGSAASASVQERPAEGSPIYVQIAALGSADSARALKARLESELSHPVRVASATGMHRVQIGPLAHAGQVEPLRDELRRAGFGQAFIVNGAE